MKEVWKNIPYYFGAYQVSNLGRIKSNKGKTERILKPHTNSSGYLQVGLSKSGKQKFVLIHRLVAQAFLPNPNNLPQINHKNEIKDDNRVKNLEWCTPKYNNNYGHHAERIAQKFIPTTQSGRELVKQFLQQNGIKATDLTKIYGMTKQEVSDYVSGRKVNPAGNKLILKVIHDFNIS